MNHLLYSFLTGTEDSQGLLHLPFLSVTTMILKVGSVNQGQGFRKAKEKVFILTAAHEMSEICSKLVIS